MFFDCRLYIKPIPTITSNAQVAVPIHEKCLYMGVYVCIHMHILMGWCVGDMAPVRLWCAFLAPTRKNL